MKNGKLIVVELISELMAQNGAETFFYNLVSELSKNESIELHIVLLHKNICPAFMPLFNDEKINIHVIGKRNGPDLLCALSFKKLVKKIRPDIINSHLNCLLTYCIAFGRRKQPFSLIHTRHSIFEKSETRYIKYLSKSKGIVMIGISDLVSRQIVADFPKMQVFTIYNGIPLIECNSLPKEYDFIIVASFTPAKNHTLLIDAFNKYCDQFGDSTLQIVGDGPLKLEIKNYAALSKHKAGIFFVGQQQNVYPFLLKSQVFVLSSHFEGNPISILEAMNAGLPIVSTAVGGIPDVVKDAENGFLAIPEDSDSLCLAMRKGITADNNGDIGNYNRKYVRRYDIKNTAEQYVQTFLQCKEEGRRK